MVAVIAHDMEVGSVTDFLPTSRQAFRAVVDEIAARAKVTLPACHGRIDKAVQLVLHGDVELRPDGHARVASQCQGTTVYHLVNGTCECRDYPQAPSGWCKHRIAAGILRRAMQAVQAVSTSSAASTQPAAAAHNSLPALVDAPLASPPRIPAQYLVELHGKPFVTYAGLLQMAHARGLQHLTVTWTYNDQALSLATAVAVFSFGAFEECGDATPDNVTKKVSPHFRRVALTRAKARVLRDALGIDVVSLEELAE